MTVAFIVSATGGKVTEPIVIWKSKIPRCFRYLYLIDNAPCHPPDLKGKFSNINVCFLPKNTTSRLQPLDAGIIQNFKVKYRKLLLKFVISRKM